MMICSYTYDKRGNIVGIEEKGDFKQLYTYDSTNKMYKVVAHKNVVGESGSGSGGKKTVTIKYTYDGAGNRVNAKVESNGSVTSNTTYVVDPESAYNDIIMAEDSVAGKTSIFTFSDEVISVETSGNISYYRTDEKHSVTDILDEAGKVQATIEYDEYGIEVVSTSGNIFAYTGHVYEESTGLYYAKARYYDAEIGRFVSEDSFRGELNDSTSLNLYTYCTNNSIVYYDPTGDIKTTTITDVNYWKINKYLWKGINKGKSKSTPTKVSKKGLNFIASMEVGKKDLILDANGNIIEVKPTLNNTTIGYGYDLTKDPLKLGIKKAKNISQATALKYLKRVSNQYAKKIATSKDITVILSQHQLDALVALRYNVGSLGVVSNLLNDINNEASYSTMRKHIHEYYERLVKNNSNNAKYLVGWKNRADAILNIYFKGDYGKLPIDAVKGRVK